MKISHTFIAFLLLIGVIMGILTASLYQGGLLHVLLVILSLPLILFNIFAVFREHQSVFVMNAKALKDVTYSRSSFSVFMAVLGGGLLTTGIAQVGFINVVVASALVGLIGGLFLKSHQVPIYCGSFVGMAAHTSINGWMGMVIAGSVAGIVFLLAGQVFNGYGGKLGAIALLGTFAAGIASGNSHLIFVNGTAQWSWFLTLSVLFGGLATYWIQKQYQMGVVISSALVGLLMGMLMPTLWGPIGTTGAVAGFCGSFVGMSAKDRLPSAKELTIACVFAAFLFQFTSFSFIGLGGKLGAIAFVSSMGTHGLFQILGSLKSSG